MWAIFESRKASKQLKKCPQRAKKQYETWKKVIEFSGPYALRDIPGFRDHGLKGEWQGARSSFLDFKWRVIYFMEEKQTEVKVLEVTPHDYRKKD